MLYRVNWPQSLNQTPFLILNDGRRKKVKKSSCAETCCELIDDGACPGACSQGAWPLASQKKRGRANDDFDPPNSVRLAFFFSHHHDLLFLGVDQKVSM
jgi:hypothetical protein